MVWALALRHARRPRPDLHVATALARLPFASWHARWPPWAEAADGCARWQPLAESFRAFRARGADPDELLVWWGARPAVPLRCAVAHLLTLARTGRSRLEAD